MVSSGSSDLEQRGYVALPSLTGIAGGVGRMKPALLYLPPTSSPLVERLASMRVPATATRLEWTRVIGNCWCPPATACQIRSFNTGKSLSSAKALDHINPECIPCSKLCTRHAGRGSSF
jgi:hypothetical protein